jgi:hypothetical protein
VSDPISERSEDAPQVLAFYLPQFHHVPENDAWHGPGFTEWNVVAQSKPLYPGHRQPDLPGELGFYDLRVPETRYLQARLAREHGITGFLYYHYWFSGRRMLGRPFQEVLDSGHPDFPFALCWANESWYRRWQGTLDEMILEQSFSEEDDIEHIRWLIECFRDPRYIRVQGRPLLAVYRAHFLPDPRRTVELWRRECERAGVEAPWLVMFETSEELQDPALLGFDASAEFVPHHLPQLVGLEPLRFGTENSHRMYEYGQVASAYLNRPEVDWQRYPCVPTAWDNAPRRQHGEALVLHGSTPERYGQWLDQAVERQSRSSGGDGIVFINAWNEWAEGAHLEPDVFWGREYLEVTREVLRARFGSETKSAESAEPVHPQPVASEDLYHDLYVQFVELQQLASGILSFADRRIRELKKHYESKLGWANYETDQIVEMNEWLVEQLELQAERMRDLALPDAPSADWLTVRTDQAPARDHPETDTEVDADVDEDGGSAAELAELLNGVHSGDEEPSEAVLAARAARAADELRRDEGFDDPPGESTPLWMIDIHARD